MNFNVKEVIFKGNTEVGEREEAIKNVKYMSKVVVNQALFDFAGVLYKLYILLAGIDIINSGIFEGRSNDKFTTMMLIFGLCFVIEMFIDYVISITGDVTKGIIIMYVTISIFLIGTAVIAPVADVKQVLILLFVEYFIANGILYLNKRVKYNKLEKENINIINEAGINNVELRIIENTKNNLNVVLSIKNMTTNKESYGKTFSIKDIRGVITKGTTYMLIDNKQGFKAVLKTNEEQLKRINAFIYGINTKMLDEAPTINLFKALQQSLCIPAKASRANGLFSFQQAEEEDLGELDKELSNKQEELKEIINERETLEI